MDATQRKVNVCTLKPAVHYIEFSLEINILRIYILYLNTWWSSGDNKMPDMTYSFMNKATVSSYTCIINQEALIRVTLSTHTVDVILETLYSRVVSAQYQFSLQGCRQKSANK